MKCCVVVKPFRTRGLQVKFQPGVLCVQPYAIIYLFIYLKFYAPVLFPLCCGPEINWLRQQSHVHVLRRLRRSVSVSHGWIPRPPLPPLQTDYFHLFLCVAIIVLYGEDVTEQQLATDQMLLHFSNLSMHMNGELVLRKVPPCTRRLVFSLFCFFVFLHFFHFSFHFLFFFLQDAVTFVKRVCARTTSTRCAHTHTPKKTRPSQRTSWCLHEAALPGLRLLCYLHADVPQVLNGMLRIYDPAPCGWACVLMFMHAASTGCGSVFACLAVRASLIFDFFFSQPTPLNPNVFPRADSHLH